MKNLKRYVSKTEKIRSHYFLFELGMLPNAASAEFPVAVNSSRLPSPDLYNIFTTCDDPFLHYASDFSRADSHLRLFSIKSMYSFYSAPSSNLSNTEANTSRSFKSSPSSQNSSFNLRLSSLKKCGGCFRPKLSVFADSFFGFFVV